MSNNPKQRYGDRKVPLQLIPPAACVYMALGLREGAFKYDPWNFRETQVELMTYIGAMKRHLDAIVDGDWFDLDPVVRADGMILDCPPKPHLAGALASGAILADAYEGGFLIDNRPPRGRASQLLKEYELNESV